jgi:hypothetical protein
MVTHALCGEVEVKRKEKNFRSSPKSRLFQKGESVWLMC